MTQAPRPEPTHEQRQWAMWANLAGLLALVNIPFANVIGSLVIYLKGRSENSFFVREHARNALNFQITFSIVVVLVTIVAVGVWAGLITSYAASTDDTGSAGLPVSFFIWIVAIFAFVLVAQVVNVVLSVVGAVAASNGRDNRYPGIPFVR